MGPCIAVADVNGDGRDDFFVGGSKDIKGSIFKQDQKGTFSEIDVAAFVNDKKFEDTGARFFDADNDGDQDLLVASGGNEFRDNSSMYPLRLYINNGKGHFAAATNFPLINCSGKAIVADDFDKDGWIDVFVGGRVVPGHYGLVPQSFLLKNNKGNFENIGQLNENLTSAGMVTDAVWCDVDKDSWKDLVLVGEWMPLTIFKNNKGTLEKKPVVFENSYGWWNTIYPCDYDKDGDIDLIGGNISANTRYRGNELYPITMVVSDFDENGSTDCVISMFQEGVSYPVPLRDNMLDQMTVLKKKFLRYKDYSTAKVNDIFTEEQLSKAINYKANNIANTLFINDSTGNFSSQLLSVRSQFFPVQAVVSTDVDKDGNADILLAGNDYSTEVETGRNDAGIGLMLKYLGGGKFKTLSYVQSGFYVPGDVKCMLPITIGNKSCLIVGKNQGDIQVIEINPEEKN